MRRAVADPPLDDELRGRITQHLRTFERVAVERGDRRAAAVACALVDDHAGRACFVLTRRSPKLKNHGGQWALPGGRVDPGESAPEAALRELHEEVGLDVGVDGVIGLLDDYPTRSGFVITPVVVWAGAARELSIDPQEVAEVYRIPLRDLEQPDVPRLRRIPESDRPVISIPLAGANVHAPTAAVVYQLREVAVHGRSTRVAHYEQPVFAWR